MPTEGCCTATIQDEYFSRPAPDAYEVVAATDMAASLRECDHTYRAGRPVPKVDDACVARAESYADAAGGEGGGAGAAAGAGAGFSGGAGASPGAESGRGDIEAGTDADAAALERLASARRHCADCDRLQPPPRRPHGAFASQTLRFDAPLALSNYRFEACPSAHRVPDAVFPADILGGALAGASGAGAALGLAPRPELFGGGEHEPGQEAFYRPKESLAKEAAQAPCPTRYHRTRRVPRRVFPSCVLNDSAWGGPLSTEGMGRMGPGDYECQRPAAVQLHDPRRQNAAFADTTTREPLFCQHPKMRTDQGFA
eukprot:g2159.t1